MKKKYIVIVFLTVGLVLMFGSVILALNATANKDIIGGPGLPTFITVFFHEKNGLYHRLCDVGGVMVIASIILGLIRRKK